MVNDTGLGTARDFRSPPELLRCAVVDFLTAPLDREWWAIFLWVFAPSEAELDGMTFERAVASSAGDPCIHVLLELVAGHEFPAEEFPDPDSVRRMLVGGYLVRTSSFSGDLLVAFRDVIANGTDGEKATAADWLRRGRAEAFGPLSGEEADAGSRAE